MSKKIEKSPKKNGKDNKDVSFPTCVNKKEAKMVCLSDQCQEYPFFCAECDDSSCEIAHQHADKLVSVSYKEFSKRVLKDKKPIQSLSQAIKSYKEVLEKLKEDVSEFIEKEIASLDQMVQKAEQIDGEDSQLIQKLKEHQYEELTGKLMDQLWTNCMEDQTSVESQKEASEFIKVKQEEVRGISEHFEHLNQMQIDNIGDEEEDEDDKKTPQKNKAKSSSSPTKKK